MENSQIEEPDYGPDYGPDYYAALAELADELEFDEEFMGRSVDVDASAAVDTDLARHRLAIAPGFEAAFEHPDDVAF
jgi:hypothetical protein